ncbi:MAG: GAF domain-containing protein, partial [Myxococcota bacterium]
MRALVRQVLGEDRELLDRLIAELDAALAGNGQVVIDVIPELEQLIGPQPPVPQLGPSESANRFDRVFAQFIAVFAHSDHPLTIFVDDLQWADAASLRLLRLLAASPRRQHLLLLGAYRDNEVDSGHALVRTLKEISAAGGSYQTITLAPLRPGDIESLLADTLLRSTEDVAPLAALLGERTMGNPFFLRQLLALLYERGIVELDLQRGHWIWHSDTLEATHLASNVLELVIDKLQQLESATQEVLRLAACIGNTFSLSDLAVICKQTTADTLSHLWPALVAGLVLPVGGARALIGESPLGQEFDQAIADSRLHAREHGAEYRFLHDQVQQAAYALIPEQERKPVHLEIGRLMRPTVEDDALFDVVNHLNVGVELISDASERCELAELNLAAALKAKQATAYQAAVRYADSGMEALGGEAVWSTLEPSARTLPVALSMERAECAFLCGDFRRAESLFQALLGLVDDEVIKCQIRAKQLTIMVSENRMEEALILGREALEALGIDFTSDPTEEQWLAQDVVFRQLRGDRAIAALVDGPTIDNPRMEAALAILLGLSPPSYQTRPRRLHGFINVITMALNIGLRYGYAPAAGYAYVTYAFCITNMDRYEEAFEYGKLGMALNERLGNVAMQGRVTTFFTCFAQYWCEHFRECEPYWTAAYHQLRETGDYVHANFMVLTRTAMRIAQGVELSRLYQEIADDLAWIAPMGYELCHRIVRMDLQLIGNLMGRTPERMSLDDDEFSESDYVAWMRAQNDNPMGMGYYYVAVLMYRYLYGNARGAMAAGEQYMLYEPGVSGMVVIAENGFYYPLAILAAMTDMSEDERASYWPVVERLAARAARWAESCPANFENRYLLIQAEMARIRGEDYRAMELYDRAIRSASDNDYIHNVALASELAARLYYNRGRKKLARVYLDDARRAYHEWGAAGKVAQLDEEWLPRLPRQTGHVASVSESNSSSRLGEQLDLMSIVNTSRLLSSEIVEDSLIEKIMIEIIQNAGADRGCLLLGDNQGELYIRAVGRIAGEAIAVSSPDQPGDLDGTLCSRVVQDVMERDDYVVIDDATADERYREDSYVQASGSRAILCIPVYRQDELTAILYLENSLTPRAFTRDRVESLGLIAVQVAISLENAALYADMNRLNADLERLVEERTAELREAQKELLSEAHKAGMAEVASETVHNVGNVLNSVISSANSLREIVGRSSYNKLHRVNQLIERNRGRLPELFASGGKGELLVSYLQEIEKLLSDESTQCGAE